jgi:Xaa-Pro aminopeptidase
MEDLGEDYVGYDEEFKRSEQFGTRNLRLGRRLEEGFAVTVEPGIYFIPILIDRWRSEGKHTDFIDYGAVEAYRNFGGIRLEDNVVVTAGNSRVLGGVGN